MTLWTSKCFGGSAASIPVSARIGVSRFPKASNCYSESQISLNMRLPSEPKQTW